MIFDENINAQSTRNLIISDLFQFKNSCSKYIEFIGKSEDEAHVYAEKMINKVGDEDTDGHYEYYDFYEGALPFNSSFHWNSFFSVGYGLYEATMLRICNIMLDDENHEFEKQLKYNATLDHMEKFLLSTRNPEIKKRFQYVFNIEEYKRIKKYNLIRNILMHRAGAFKKDESRQFEDIHAEIVITKNTHFFHEKYGRVDIYAPALSYALNDYLHFIFSFLYYPKKNIRPKN